MGFSAKQTYAGTRLKAEDLEGRPPAVMTITEVTLDEFTDKESGQKKKLLELHFAGTDKTLSCNFANASYISELFGDDTDGWGGGRIVLYHTRVQFGAKMVGAIRVRSIEAEQILRAEAKAGAARRAAAPAALTLDNDPLDAVGPDVIMRGVESLNLGGAPRQAPQRPTFSTMPVLEEDDLDGIPF